MKIVHICVCGEFYEGYAYQDNLLPKYHRKAGHEVTIIAAPYSRFDKNTGKVTIDHTKQKYLDDGTKVIRVKAALPLFINSHIHLFYGIKKAVTREKPDLIFAHGAVCPNFLFLSGYKKKHPGVQIVYDNHGDFINSFHSPLTRWWAKYIGGKIIVKNLLWTSDHYYGTTPSRCQVLHTVFGVPESKIELLPMGADDELLHLEQKEQLRNEVRKQFDIEENDFLIVTGGKIDEKKNIHTLVKTVINIGSPVKILVFGSIDDKMKDIFVNLQASNTIYVGWVPSGDVYRYFYAADLVAFPGLHSVLWEQAVACGVPTAFSKISGFEHVNFNNNAVLFEENTEKYYESVIRQIVLDKTWYESLKKNSMSDCARMFLYSNIAQKVIDDITQKQ